ncbi:hypothetical protein HMPREF9943_00004 [Eggerthia catenaformis OT 569 = DSM 20559]|uniref:Uncharacterized protein n=1 Tax=Eggerthia catenaformis OT 569 = DSM 20559 TaxID=999415 RepID=M2PB35_9FIRM|nr:hypothetical protein HMPREF9943_00004 [Eggerthia catenaformis OT 569 = DSM 20559]
MVEIDKESYENELGAAVSNRNRRILALRDERALRGIKVVPRVIRPLIGRFYLEERL